MWVPSDFFGGFFSRKNTLHRHFSKKHAMRNESHSFSTTIIFEQKNEFSNS